MKYTHKQQNPRMSDFAYKIRSEQVAITNQIKKYKVNYLAKVIQKSNIDNFIRFSRELLVLVISYCKNIIYVAPENLSITIQELTVLFDDLLKKYHDVFLKYHQKFQEQCISQPRGHNISELCAICNQQMKKVNIDKMRTYILNQIDSSCLEKEGEQNEKLEEDALFFAEVNNLLTIKQGELLKNQIQINNYKEIALNALTYLTTMKDYFSRDSLLMPNSNWLNTAKEEMQIVLKQTFQDKIPPWIAKMLNAFWIHYHKQISKKRFEVGIQTDSNIQLQIIQLRKKIIVGKQKLQIEQNLVKTQQKQLLILKGEKGNLEGKIQYYKKQLNKLIEEIENAKIENAKIENQLLKLNLSNSKFNLTIEKNETEKQSLNQSQNYISRENILDSRKTQKLKTKANIQSLQEKILPKIKGRSQPKNSKHMQRTSIKVNLTSIQSHSILESKKSTKRLQKDSNKALKNNTKSVQNNSSIIDKILNLSVNERQVKSKKNSNNCIDFSVEKSVIKHQLGELNLQHNRLKIKQVDQQIKSAIKNGVFLKNRQKHFESSILHNTQLKRIPRQTMKIDDFNKSNAQLRILAHSVRKKRNNNTLRLSKIYNYLKESGYLIKISQQDFKDSILKIKINNQDFDQKASSFSQTKRNKRQNNSLEKSFQLNIGTNYLMLFMSIQNAYLYQTNSTKNHFKVVGKLDNMEQETCQQLFTLLTQFKAQSVDYYNLLCSFIKSPYQVISNSLGSLSITSNMKYNSFYQYFQRILFMHQKCKKIEGICNHIKQFKTKLIDQYQSLKKEK